MSITYDLSTIAPGINYFVEKLDNFIVSKTNLTTVRFSTDKIMNVAAVLTRDVKQPHHNDTTKPAFAIHVLNDDESVQQAVKAQFLTYSKNDKLFTTSSNPGQPFNLQFFSESGYENHIRVMKTKMADTTTSSKNSSNKKCTIQ